MTRILIVDNYNSFTYDPVQYVGEVVSKARGGDKSTGGSNSSGSDNALVYHNDAFPTDDVHDIDPDGTIVSSGPDTPAKAGISVSTFHDLSYPTLGVCPGHRSLCTALRSRVGHALHVVHGESSLVGHDSIGIFSRLPNRIEIGRCHSFAVEHEDVPPELTVTAYTVVEGSEAKDSDDDTGTEDDEPATVMGIRHREKPHVGVQFHPESTLADSGKDIVCNFVALAVGDGPAAAA